MKTNYKIIRSFMAEDTDPEEEKAIRPLGLLFDIEPSRSPDLQDGGERTRIYWRKEAEGIVDVLHEHLPQGLLSHLAAAFIMRQASVLHVRSPSMVADPIDHTIEPSETVVPEYDLGVKIDLFDAGGIRHTARKKMIVRLKKGHSLGSKLSGKDLEIIDYVRDRPHMLIVTYLDGNSEEQTSSVCKDYVIVS